IRDRNVTGVQTCALPISKKSGHEWLTGENTCVIIVSTSKRRGRMAAFTGTVYHAMDAKNRIRIPAKFRTGLGKEYSFIIGSQGRSEERRVGKERRRRRGP